MQDFPTKTRANSLTLSKLRRKILPKILQKLLPRVSQTSVTDPAFLFIFTAEKFSKNFIYEDNFNNTLPSTMEVQMQK